MRSVLPLDILALVFLFWSTPSIAITKCCPDEQVLGLHSKLCLTHSVSRMTDFFVSTLDDVTRTPKNTSLWSLVTTFPMVTAAGCEASQSYLLTGANFTIVTVNDTVRMIDWINRRPHSKDHFCLDIGWDERTGLELSVIKACSPCDNDKTCVNFCCSPKTSSQCNSSHQLPDDSFIPITVPLHCQSHYHYQDQALFNLSNMGMVVDGKVRDFSEYCIKTAEDKRQTVLFCNKEQPNKSLNITKTVFLVLSLISLIVLTVLHKFVKEIWRLNFTKYKMSFFVSVFFSFFFLIVGHLGEFASNAPLCIVLAVMLHYWSLALFFWLTAMNLTMWSTFRRLENPRQEIHARKARQRKERLWATYLCFGVPAVFVGVTAVLQISPPSESPTLSHLHPRLQQTCFLAVFLPQFLFFHLPVLLLLVTNVFLFLLLLHNFTCGIWWTSPTSDTWSEANRRNLRVVLELFFFMGMSWLSESVGFFLRWSKSEQWSHPGLVLLHSFNQLTGVFMLVTFLLKARNRELVREWLTPEVTDQNTEMVGTEETNLKTN